MKVRLILQIFMLVIGLVMGFQAQAQDINPEDGQCIACDYIEPTESISTWDPATVTFHDNQNATLSWTGETVSISRTFWDYYNNLDQLFGEWALTTMQPDTAPEVMIVSIEGNESNPLANGSTASINDADGESVGLITRLDDELFLTMDGLTEDLPLVILRRLLLLSRPMPLAGQWQLNLI